MTLVSFSIPSNWNSEFALDPLEIKVVNISVGIAAIKSTTNLPIFKFRLLINYIQLPLKYWIAISFNEKVSSPVSSLI